MKKEVHNIKLHIKYMDRMSAITNTKGKINQANRHIIDDKQTNSIVEAIAVPNTNDTQFINHNDIVSK